MRLLKKVDLLVNATGRVKRPHTDVLPVMDVLMTSSLFDLTFLIHHSVHMISYETTCDISHVMSI